MVLRRMVRIASVLVLALQTALVTAGQEPKRQGIETIIAIRHGELQHGGLGQLSCKGLNRALALPKALIGHYGAPDLVVAPNPSARIHEGDAGKTYSYVRPLATVEPLAIQLGLPVETQIGFRDIRQLQQMLTSPDLRSSTVLLAWEHIMLQRFARSLVAAYGGDPSSVPEWKGGDFDTIYVFQIDWTGNKPKISFRIDHEGLTSLSNSCPNS